ncbi:MAG: hypothetical protein AAB439_03290 [Patescibacteria group bacterium]
MSFHAFGSSMFLVGGTVLGGFTAVAGFEAHRTEGFRLVAETSEGYVDFTEPAVFVAALAMAFFPGWFAFSLAGNRAFAG